MNTTFKEKPFHKVIKEKNGFADFSGIVEPSRENWESLELPHEPIDYKKEMTELSRDGFKFDGMSYCAIYYRADGNNGGRFCQDYPNIPDFDLTDL